MTKQEIQNLAAKSTVELRSTVEKLRQLKGFNLKSLAGIISIVKTVVKHVETVGLVEGIKDSDKQSLAIEFICQLAPLPAWMMYFARPLLPVLIDAIVDALKDRFGV